MSAPSLSNTRVILGTATPGGGFPVYEDAVAAVINEIDDSLHVETRNTKGSTENVPLLEADQLDIALVQGEVVHDVGARADTTSQQIHELQEGTPHLVL